ncbi:hypothetical protein EMIHUDRAFT_214494 [Emiliania huxleyi CCMP1516]|uniref:Uncharacterized protein n=2 Tax=Emiliania huxleyi TaxID=2903 RepID=A0A0D3IK47_EMIH1|nr:hypothetical protein EMIHUDRAFT_214494 [Emiliania huxleyi CCMP1516]EOD11632.1 hypothetical protein EMIHUDRAFT_214494 [Emiliania huxleyi CCMP1516]|eukprot:XP_005764061.1 hypothetical protein EMIHUDRAFT_214494 [Emiliania huxleyi CCMP1516]
MRGGRLETLREASEVGAERACLIAEHGRAERGREEACPYVMKTLYLNGNEIGEEGAKALGVAAIAEALRGNGVLTSLDVGFNGLTKEQALGIVRVERQRNKLTSLGLAGCRVGPTGAAEIAEYVSGSAVLTSLDVSKHQHGRGGGPQHRACVERQRNKLTLLCLGGCGIGPTGAAEIADYVSGSGVLKTLNLESNNIGGETGYIEASEVEGESKEVGAKVIYQGREMVVSVGVDSDGDLKLVDIVQTGVLAIAKALEVNAVLNSLDVGFNGLTEEAALSIVRVQRQRNKPTSLGLARCNIGPTVAVEIAQYVSDSEVLEKIDLSSVSTVWATRGRE